jgi:hypothetical protein
VKPLEPRADIVVERQIPDPSQHMSGRLVEVMSVQCRLTGEERLQHTPGDGGEVRMSTGGRQREAIAERARKERLKEMAGGADLLKPRDEPAEIRNRLVDVEDNNAGSRVGAAVSYPVF